MANATTGRSLSLAFLVLCWIVAALMTLVLFLLLSDDGVDGRTRRSRR